jgi:hypothetical protein
MPPSTEARKRLSLEQAGLVAALVDHGDPPEGFDEGRLCAAAKSLSRKRTRAVARTWPNLTRALGARFDGLFSAYTESAAPPGEMSALADGRRFARWLACRGELPDEGRLEALAVDLRYTTTPDGLVPRRWPACRVARLRSGRIVAAIRLPWFKERWLHLAWLPALFTKSKDGLEQHEQG